MGHLEIDCYRLYGFPNDFEFTKTKDYPGSAKVNSVTTGEEMEKGNTEQEAAANNTYIPYMNKDQYANLVQQVAKDIKAGTSNASFNTTAITGPFDEEHSSFW